MIYKKAKDSLKPKKPPQGEKSAKAGKKMTVQLVDFKKLIQEKKNCERKSIDSSMLSLLPQSIVKASIDSKSNKSGQPQTLLKKKKSETKDLSTPAALLAVSPLLPTSRNGVGRISMDVTKASEAPKSSSSIKKLVAMKALKSKRKNHDSSGAKNDSSTPSGIANDP